MWSCVPLACVFARQCSSFLWATRIEATGGTHIFSSNTIRSEQLGLPPVHQHRLNDENVTLLQMIR